MTEPLLELGEAQRFLGVVQVAGDSGSGAGAGGATTDVPLRNPRLCTQNGNESEIEVVLGHGPGAEREEHGDPLARPPVDEFGLGGSLSLPLLEGAPEDRVDRSREGRARLCDGDVE